MQLMPDGRNVTGCFTADFTLAEVGALRARQAIPFRGHARDGEFRWETVLIMLPILLSILVAGMVVVTTILALTATVPKRRIMVASIKAGMGCGRVMHKEGIVVL